MGLLNSIGAYFLKQIGGWTFGTNSSKLTFKGNAGIEGDPANQGFEHTLPNRSGMIALTDEIGGGGPINPADYDLEEFNNNSADPFIRTDEFYNNLPSVPSELDELGNNGADPYVRNSGLPSVPTDLSELTNLDPNNPYLRTYDRPAPFIKLVATNIAHSEFFGKLLSMDLGQNFLENTGVISIGNTVQLTDLTTNNVFRKYRVDDTAVNCKFSVQSLLSSSHPLIRVQFYHHDFLTSTETLLSQNDIDLNYMSFAQTEEINFTTYLASDIVSFSAETAILVCRISVIAIDTPTNVQVGFSGLQNHGIGIFTAFNNLYYKKIIDDTVVGLDKLQRRKNGLYYWNDFFGVGQNDTGQFINDTIMNFVSVGTGAFNRPLRNAENPAQVTNSNIGVLQQSTGTTSTGQARAEIGSNGGSIVIGAGVVVINTLVCMSALSDVSNRFSYKYILPSLLPSGIHAIGFVYDEGGVDNMSSFTASPNWQVITRNSSISTVVDTGIPVSATNLQNLVAIINAAGTRVDFYIDGVPIPPVFTNIPTGWAKKLMFNSIILKFTGTAERIAYVDYIELDQTLTTPRV